MKLSNFDDKQDSDLEEYHFWLSIQAHVSSSQDTFAGVHTQSIKFHLQINHD